MSDDRLAGMNVELATMKCHMQRSTQNHRELIELRRLPRLDPAAGAGHPSDAKSLGRGVDATDEFFDPFGFVSRGLNDGWRSNVRGHNGSFGKDVILSDRSTGSKPRQTLGFR